MKALGVFPSFAAGNTDFIDPMRTRVSPGEQVLVTDIEVDSLPDGVLCLHQDTVAEMVRCLGWELVTEERTDELINCQVELALCQERLAAFQHLEQLVDQLGQKASR